MKSIHGIPALSASYVDDVYVRLNVRWSRIEVKAVRSRDEIQRKRS